MIVFYYQFEELSIIIGLILKQLYVPIATGVFDNAVTIFNAKRTLQMLVNSVKLVYGETIVSFGSIITRPVPPFTNMD